jgi:predicted MFS family arabinose efflux permease
MLRHTQERFPSMEAVSPNSLKPKSVAHLLFDESSKNRWIILCLLCCAFTVSFDQNMTSPNLSLMATDFTLSEAERDSKLGGLVMFGYFTVGGIASLVISPLAETGNKKSYLIGLVGLSGLANFFSFLTEQNREGFLLFFLSRLISGVSVGGTLPLAMTMVCDLVPNDQRTVFTGLIGTLATAGSAIGQLCSAASGIHWRAAYLFAALVAAANAFYAVLLNFESSLTKRRDSKDFNLSHSIAWGATPESAMNFKEFDLSQFNAIIDIPSNRYLFAQCVFGSMGWSVVATFLADFLNKDLQYSVLGATFLMTTFGLSSLVASMFGSSHGQKLYNECQKRSLAWFIGLTSAVGAFPMMLLVTADPHFFLAVVLICLGSIAAIAGPNIKGLVLAVNETRKSVLGVFQLVEMCAKGIGPLVMSLICLFLPRRFALCFSFLGWVGSGVLLCQLEESIETDTEESSRRKPKASHWISPFDEDHVL